MRIAVAGGTGQVGARVVERLRGDGDDAVVLSRSVGVDIVSGAGLADRLEGVEAIVDCTSVTTGDRQECVDFFGAEAQMLQQMGELTGVRRIVTLSIVGIDAMPGLAHYAGKLAQERATRDGAVPATILRATQFHTFGGAVMAMYGKGPILLGPAYPVQTVDLEPVTEHLVRLARGEQEGETINLAGPQRLSLATVVRRTARARGRRGLVVPLWLPTAWFRAARAGAALPPVDAVVEGRSFDDWIQAGAPV